MFFRLHMDTSQNRLFFHIALNRFAATEEAVRKELRRYTLDCANFLRSNGIEDNSKAGFVSAIILGLTNKESELYI